MRLWSIHPSYLDIKGFLGLWREALLAQKALLGETKGYKNHPQLLRFKRSKDPILYIGTYLYHVYLEGKRRGCKLDKSKIIKYDISLKMPVNRGQVEYEFQHLLKKLEKRDIRKYRELKDLKSIEVHPLFYIVEGGIEDWEKLKII
ncbi:pyrimidine dimer DNA glycosylase/endonuclease V [Saccharolobus caldissimus]|uniref:Pyrimidine dimer DNA glycosylase n=1 Tax=Saccharolobus caldissimus TaxID=1702097 RepID=A0AAQ4CQF3_9CREN|nr:pyrimidine dimer DNA glycosylase/endonuclease V [Saccharolobus caldissimus]BDB98034.1 hypothetical protein SACC_10510 [Saccharolobus caldissimus]